jgi:hypothetical protein
MEMELVTPGRGGRCPRVAGCRPRRDSCRPAPRSTPGDLAGIGEAMHRADRHIGGFDFVIEPHLLADRHLGDAAHHNAMLGAVEVLLQRQPRAGVHADAPDLVARPGIGALVNPMGGRRGGAPAPRSGSWS